MGGGVSEFTLRVGSAEIIALTDMNVLYPMTLDKLFPEVPIEAWEEYREKYPGTLEGPRARLEIGCYVVRTGGQTILIDTGYGPGPIEGELGILMDGLASSGVAPNDVDMVFLSHLHPDHVGWNVKDGEGGVLEPMFPNARYIVHELDLAHFRKPEVQETMSFPFMDRLVESIVGFGMLDTLSEDVNLTPEVRVVHTPGHTPGHMSVVVASGGEEALIQGDVFVHPAQITEDGWNCHFDVDWPVSEVTRRKMLEEVEAKGTPMISCHFPLPGFGKVTREDGKRIWQVGLDQ